MKPGYLLLVLLAAMSAGRAERLDPAKWSLAIEPGMARPGATVLARLKARIEPGWHLYSLTTPPGPIATTIRLAEGPAVEKFRVFEPPPKRAFDANFSGDTETYEGEPVFLIELELKNDASP